MRSRRLQRDLFFPSDELQMLRDQVCRDAVEIESLAAAQDGWQNFLRLSRRENKFHMLGRFFQRFQKRVKRCRREHVHLIDQINFVATFRRSIRDVLAQLAHVFHAVVARAVNLDHVETVPRGDLAAVIAFPAWRDRRAFHAIERLCQDARGRCFPNPARPDKQISVRQTVLCHRIFERARDMRLPHQIVKRLRAIFPCENLVAHAINLDGNADSW